MSTNSEGEIEIKPYSPYRISVVKTDNGYLVNHYSKRQDDLLPTFADVVNRLFGYGTTTHLKEPHLRYLTPSEENAVKIVRDSVLRLSRLEDENRFLQEEKIASNRSKPLSKRVLGSV